MECEEETRTGDGVVVVTTVDAVDVLEKREIEFLEVERNLFLCWLQRFRIIFLFLFLFLFLFC